MKEKTKNEIKYGIIAVIIYWIVFRLIYTSYMNFPLKNLILIPTIFLSSNLPEQMMWAMAIIIQSCIYFIIGVLISKIVKKIKIKRKQGGKFPKWVKYGLITSAIGLIWTFINPNSKINRLIYTYTLILEKISSGKLGFFSIKILSLLFFFLIGVLIYWIVTKIRKRKKGK